MPNDSLARSKSASDLARFRDLMNAVRRLSHSPVAAQPYLEVAKAMVLTKRIYFVGV